MSVWKLTAFSNAEFIESYSFTPHLFNNNNDDDDEIGEL